MLSGNHPFFDKFDAIFASRTEKEGPSEPGMHQDVRPVMPIHFYDRHLASNLQLRRVEIVPEIPNLLGDFAETEVDDYFSCDRSFSPSKMRAFPEPLRPLAKQSSHRTAKTYEYNYSGLSSIASQLYLFPDIQSWAPFAFNVHCPLGVLKFLTVGGLKTPDNWVGADAKPPDPKVVATMQELDQHSPLLAIWNFFGHDDSAEALLKSMKGTEFHWDTTATRSMIPLDDFMVSTSADARTGFIAQFINSHKALMNKRTFADRAMKRKLLRRQAPGDARLASVRRTLGATLSRPYRADAKQFLQHAWSQAAFNDATFVVFSCGRYERIGIRHRRSQTLFLSGLLDSTSRQNLRYGKIQAGLQMAIIQDALNRQLLRQGTPTVGQPMSQSRATSPKRKAEEDSDQATKKRLKSQAPAPLVDSAKLVLDALSDCSLALMSLQCGIYNSPRPSAFVRIGPSCVTGSTEANLDIAPSKMVYNRQEYVHLRLSEVAGDGATGVIHRAVASKWSDKGERFDHAVVVKLVFPESVCDVPGEIDFPAQERLRNEFKIYQHLAKSGVSKGILPVYGLFEDMESGVLALIMGDGGQSLADRELQNGGSAWKLTLVSDAERESLCNSLRQIHDAQIRHCDIRGQNIVVHQNGDVRFVDFDKAQHCTRTKALDREYKCLEKILDGYEDYQDFYSF